MNLKLVGLGGVTLAFVDSALLPLIQTPMVPSPVESLMNSPLLLILFGVMAITLAPFFDELLFRACSTPTGTYPNGKDVERNQ